MKKIISLLLVLVCIFSLAACKKGDDNNITLVEEGKLIVVTSSDYAPYEFIDLTKTGQDKFVGSDISLAKFLANKLGLTLEIKAMDFNALLTALDSGKADLAIAGLSYTEDRAAYLFSSCYYGDGDGGQIVVTLKENSSKYNSLETLNVKENKIAAQNGALQVGLVKTQLPNASLIEITDLDNALTMLKNGTYDSIAIASNVAQSWMATNDDIVVAATFDYEDTGSYAVASPKAKSLIDAINPIIEESVAKAGADGKTQYEKWVDEAQALFIALGDKAAEENPNEESGDLD